MKPSGPYRAAGLARGVMALAALGVLLATRADAQAPDAPRRYAIQNARIVTVSGPVIDRGTVVIENGLITAVGRNVQAPADAWPIDGSGWTVYPGLVNAMSNLGMPASMRAATGPARRGPGQGGPEQGSAQTQAPHSWGPEDRPATMTWVNAADEIEADDDRLESWRNGGFTTVMTSPERGLFPGQTAMMNLAGSRPNDMVLATPIGLRVNLQKGREFPGYPNSLMGSIAYVKQLFFDAAHYDQAWSIYEESPAGLERPDYDRALEPLRATLAGNVPVLMPGNEARQILRAIDIGQETGTSVIVYGGQEGYRVADRLAAERIPVLLNVDWPGPAEDGDPDAEPALSQLRFWDRAPTTPRVLADAGVRFAFYSGGLDDAEAVRAAVSRAISQGLSPDHAIRALTLGPAEIFGIGDRVGSIEDGKIANLVVTDGDLFERGTNVRMVFVDGRKFDVELPEAMARRGGTEETEGEQGEGRPGRGRRGAAWDAPSGAPIPMTNDRGPIRDSRVTLIQNATIMTATNGTIENGSILIRDGKIAEVGQNISAPGGADVVDASGKYVIPGIIDAHSHIAADAINEGAVAVSSMVGIEDVLNPDQLSIYRAIAGGVTSANILHGSANPIGGKNAMLKLRWGADANGLLMEGAPKGIKFALGENTKRTRTPARYPNSRMGVQDVIRQAFIEAQEYREEWQEYELASSRGERAIPPARDLELEALVEILEGERLVHAHSYRADEILQLLRVAEEFGFQVATLQHVLEGYRVADEIAEHGAGASTFSDWWGYKVEAYEAIPHNAALMTERGVTVSINSDSGEEMRHLNQEAAKAMKWGGLSEEEALKLVTINPARQLRIDDRVGSIEVGKDADLVIYNSNPLSVYSIVEQTYIDGKLYFDREHDMERRKELEDEKRALLEKHKRSDRQRPAVTTDVAAVPGGIR